MHIVCLLSLESISKCSYCYIWICIYIYIFEHYIYICHRLSKDTHTYEYTNCILAYIIFFIIDSDNKCNSYTYDSIILY